jgi:membrane-associated protease RseP (regulator of RpoE activity)
MRRLHGLWIAAALAAVPTSAVAGPKPPDSAPKADPKSDDSTTQTFEWSTSTRRARLGVMVIGLTPELRRHFGAPGDRGVMVGHIEPKSSAAAAGLEVGDILTEVKGTAIDSASDVLDALSTSNKDEVVTIAVIRDAKPITVSAKMPNDPGPRIRKMMRPGKFPNYPSWMDDWFDQSHGPTKNKPPMS